MSAYIITWVSNNGSVDDGVERASEGEEVWWEKSGLYKVFGKFFEKLISRMAEITKVKGPTNFSRHFDIDYDLSFNILFFWHIPYFPAAMRTC